MKIDTEVLQQVLQSKDIPNDTVRAILDEVIAKVESTKAPRVKAPKKPFVLLVSDPNGVIPEGTELVGWAVQMDEGVSVERLVPNILKAVGEFNDTDKGRKQPVELIGDAFDTISTKKLAECGVYRKHKEAVFVVITDNKVPST